MKPLITTIITIPVFLSLAACTNSQQESVLPLMDKAPIPVVQTEPSFVFTEKEYDFGIIKQSGGKVKHEFKFTYNGKDPVKITGLPTSCACASASVDKTQLMNWDTGVMTVTFNPNLHAEPEGRFFKSIMIRTDPPLSEQPEVKMWAEIDLDLGPEAFELKEDHNDEEEHGEKKEYHSITPEELSSVLVKENSVFIDVHIPEQEHIQGTDLFIPYNEIIDNLQKLPSEKDTPIVLYCRSGNMSKAAAYVLTEQGFTNVYDLVGGKNAYDDWLTEK